MLAAYRYDYDKADRLWVLAVSPELIMGEVVTKPKKTVPITPKLSFIVPGSRKSRNVVGEVLPGVVVANDQT